MPNAYFNEEHLVELPAFTLFASLEWGTASAVEETFGPVGTFRREMSGEVVLVSRLRKALIKLNSKLPTEAIEMAITELTRDHSAMELVAANREIYGLLKEGVPVSVPDQERGGQRPERVRVMDWDNPAENDFLAIRQITFTGPLYTCRPDIVGFVNGLPLVVLEFKKPSVPVRNAFDENLTSYKHAQNGISALFWYNAFMIVSNGTESRVGSITADWDRFFEWKRIANEAEPRKLSLSTIITGLCDKTRLMDVLENFTIFSELKSGRAKIVSQNHQYLGVNSAIAASMKAHAAGHGRGGVFWHTQGAGKSYSMVFFAQKILRKIPGNWTFVVVTDRVELDDQIAKTFKACGAVSEAESKECHATSGEHLRELLAGNHRYIFTLIHKFQTTEMLCDRRDVIVLTDEAHRSQYDTLALNMRSALPNALFLAFTGTPLIAGEERTREVFGDYVSIYDFQQSVDDNATVSLFYENRTPELQLVNPTLNEDIYRIVEDAGLDEAKENRLQQLLGQRYHILTRDERLDTIARDIVRHFLGRGFQGKAMVVSLDKATALRMHDKVRKYWAEETARVKKELGNPGLGVEEKDGLLDRLQRLQTVDMALIVSPGQNEIEQMKSFGLDIVPHRLRMSTSQPSLDEKFKDPNDPLSIVFLCAMWLTGFDVPSCSTIYLDKPMRNHTLMQTIARANRVFAGKRCGLIVDYANVLASLEKALAIYGKGDGGQKPIRDKKALLEELRKAVGDALDLCKSHGVDIPAIEKLPGSSMERLAAVADAVEKLISPDTVRKEFLAAERLVTALYKAIMPDVAALEFSAKAYCMKIIADIIRGRTNGPEPVDVSKVMSDINRLLDESITAEGFRIDDKKGAQGSALIDLSRIDFEALARRFKDSRRKNVELEALKRAIRAKLERLVLLNKSRSDYLSKFEEMIEEYNAGSRNIDDLFKDLLKFSRSLTEEEERHVRENLTEEELTVFDVLTRPGPNLTSEERDQVKKVARHLLHRLHILFVLNWRETVQHRAQVRLAIEDELDQLPGSYGKEMYQHKCSDVFEHVYESYVGDGKSVFVDLEDMHSGEPVELPRDADDLFFNDVIQDGRIEDSYLPIYDLQAVATSFREQTKPQIKGWKPMNGRKVNKDMFIAQVVGKSMEPTIADGSWCLFRFERGGSRHGVYLIESRQVTDPETGLAFTIKRYHSEKEDLGNDQWRHKRIVLSPDNKDFKDIILENVSGDDFRVVAEFIEILKT